MTDKTGGPAFPVQDLGANCAFGMSLHDYATIHFAAAWAIVLGTQNMEESRAQRAELANRLGRLQADAMIAARRS